MRHYLAWSAYGLTAAFLAVFLLLPLGVCVAGGLDPVYFREAFANPVYRQGFINAGLTALVTTVLAVGLALPLAWIAGRCSFRGKALAEAMLLTPLITPPFVGALGVAQLFGQYGAINSLGSRLGWWAAGEGPDWLGHHRFLFVCVLEALHLFPILYLNLATSLARLDPSLIEAAQALGAGPWTRFRRVVLPLIRPGLFAGGIVVAVWSFTDVGTPLMLGFDRTTPVQILNGILELEGDRTPFALVVVMLVLAGGAYLVAHQVFARRHDALVTKTAQAASPRRLGVGGTALAWLVFGAVIAVAAAPNLAVVLIAVSREWYATVLPTALTLDHLRLALAHELVVPGVVNSLQYAAAATVLALVLGTFIAWTSARWRPVGWQALDLMAMLPLAIPGIVLAFGYFSMATRLPWLKAWLDPVVWPVPLLIIAYAVRRLPFVVRSVHAGFQQVPLAYEEAASALGAGPACRLRRIVLPLLLGSLAAGAILTFSYSMLEVSDSLVLAQKRAFFPVTRVLFELTGILGGGAAVACAFALWAMAFLAATLAAAAAFLGKDVSGLLRD